METNSMKFTKYFILSTVILLSTFSCRKNRQVELTISIKNNKYEILDSVRVTVLQAGKSIESFTNNLGEAKVKFEMGKFVLDSVKITADKKGYITSYKNDIVGDNYNAKYEIIMNKVGDLQYNSSPMVFSAQESSKTLNILNDGVVPVKCQVISPFAWITFGQVTEFTVDTAFPFDLNVFVNATNLDCYQEGFFLVNWNDVNTVLHKDTIRVSKYVLDNSTPNADFSVSKTTQPPTPLQQFDSLYFDASLSTDNCTQLPMTYRWKFGATANFTSWESNPVKLNIFNTPSIYTVTLEVKDGQGNISSTSKNITIDPKPTKPQLMAQISVVQSAEYLVANLSAELLSTGTGTCIAHGFVWSDITTEPSISNYKGKTDLGIISTVGIFIDTAKALLPNKKYFFRGYATNNYGTSYTTAFEFTPIVVKFLPVNTAPFIMGNSAIANQTPTHSVNLNNFEIGETEVTNRQYTAFLNATLVNQTIISQYIDYQYADILFINGVWVAKPNTEEKPVITVSWNGAVAFCNWLGARLPTEAEWEFAAKYNSGNPYLYAGSNIANQVAVYSSAQLANVKSKSPNPNFQTYDMCGNALEWCSDWYANSYGSSSAVINPIGPSTGTYKVLRGGSFLDPENLITTTFRHRNSPNFNYNNVGFRCVR
jgi:sulfatase modifying factor 1